MCIRDRLEQERLLHLVRTRNAQLSGVCEAVKGGMLLCSRDGEVLQINKRARHLPVSYTHLAPLMQAGDFDAIRGLAREFTAQLH